MYIDYSSWETFEYKASTLNLDVNNPRIKYKGNIMNQTQILRFLIQNEKVYELARKISEEGYFVGEEPIICIEDNKKVVLEGNRRTAAIKLLQDPKKYLSTAKANVLLKNIIANNFPVDKRIKCYIAPNRLLANPIIYERHNGATLQRWKTGNQYAFVAEMYYEDGLSIEDICDVLNEKRPNILKPLKAFNLFFEGKEVFEREEETSVDIAEFNFTNLERFYSYEEARKFLGIEFNEDDGELSLLIPREEFEKRILEVFRKLLDAERFSRDFNKEDDKVKYLNELKSNPKFDLTATAELKSSKSKTSEERANLEEQKNKVTSRKKTNSKRDSYDNFIIPRDVNIIFDNEKLDGIFNELKSLPIEKKYSFAILLRTYLEQSLYYYLSENSKFEDLNKKSNEERKKDGLAKIKTLVAHLQGKYSFQGEIDSAPIMGILKFNGSSDYSTGLKQMLDYVKNNELDNHLDAAQLRSTKHYLDRIKDGLDLAVHNINTIIDTEHNKRAWIHLVPLFEILSNNIIKK
ncbi:hypothetical protein [uncultured Pedobacter sp.]|uniref:hypothetical protein n=1 Tax=uncultured Pedobacter sp. TaxID=246139 RepID=UPI0025E7ED21|nr:hypothetical protein [uncultured Pedobacter sp.]